MSPRPAVPWESLARSVLCSPHWNQGIRLAAATKRVSKAIALQQLHTSLGLLREATPGPGWRNKSKRVLSHTQALAVEQMAHLRLAHLAPAALPTGHSITQVSPVWKPLPPPVNTFDKTGQVAQPPRTGRATRHSWPCWIKAFTRYLPSATGPKQADVICKIFSGYYYSPVIKKSGLIWHAAWRSMNTLIFARLWIFPHTERVLRMRQSEAGAFLR